jgi:NADPH:quinone reductase-like Zn-dependent oxidoreductase
MQAEAWVIHARNDDQPAELSLETIELSPLAADEVLVAPLYGCWEGNMSHAIRRRPVDVCRLRLEKRVVLGNAGVVRVLAAGADVTSVSEGDAAVLVPVGALDEYGYMTRIFGFDASGTIGLLSKRTKLKQHQLFRIPPDSPHSLAQWAATSVRYATAWDNWQVSYACYRSQMSVQDEPAPWVWGWGGGVVWAELQLAARANCRVAMLASSDARLERIRGSGIVAVDRREFPDLQHDPQRFDSDSAYRERYLFSERAFLRTVNQITDRRGVAIFIDNIGGPVYRPTVRALARQGVITTSGWDKGGDLRSSRIEACIQRHIYVNTHGARYSRGVEACEYIAAESNAWVPQVDSQIWPWERIPELAEQFGAGRIDSYFPLYQVNPEYG